MRQTDWLSKPLRAVCINSTTSRPRRTFIRAPAITKIPKLLAGSLLNICRRSSALRVQQNRLLQVTNSFAQQPHRANLGMNGILARVAYWRAKALQGSQSTQLA